jgi:hypothetical protein
MKSPVFSAYNFPTSTYSRRPYDYNKARPAKNSLTEKSVEQMSGPTAGGFKSDSTIVLLTLRCVVGNNQSFHRLVTNRVNVQYKLADGTVKDDIVYEWTGGSKPKWAQTQDLGGS